MENRAFGKATHDHVGRYLMTIFGILPERPVLFFKLTWLRWYIHYVCKHVLYLYLQNKWNSLGRHVALDSSRRNNIPPDCRVIVVMETTGSHLSQCPRYLGFVPESQKRLHPDTYIDPIRICLWEVTLRHSKKFFKKPCLSSLIFKGCLFSRPSSKLVGKI